MSEMLKNRQPGDLTKSQYLERLVRVNHAGEYGAKRIYEGQIAALKNRNDAEARAALEKIEHMAEQEREHLDYFNNMMLENRVRPTIMTPIWHVGGFLLGAVTAKMGVKAAMACTVAVESVIDEHYARQLEVLDGDDKQLKSKISKFRDEEIEHHDIGLEEGASEAPFAPVLLNGIRKITSAAIWLSSRI